MVLKMPNMKPLDLTNASQSPILIVWFGIAVATFGLLFLAEWQELFEPGEQAVIAEPLNASGLINLAVLANRQGNHVAAEKFYTLASRLSGRNYAAQTPLIDTLIGRGQVSEALVHIDGVLRTKPQQSPQIYAVLAALAQREDGLPALVKLLASDPPWRRNFLNFASADVAYADTVYSVLAEMRKNHIAIADAEIRGYLKNLIEHKNVPKAYFVWLDFLNERQLRNVKLLYDGDFSVPSQNLFFDWTVKALSDVGVSEVARVGGQGEQSLMVDFARARPNSNMIEQILMLPPGNFSLQGEVNAKNLHSDIGVHWQIRCEEKTSAIATMAGRSAGQGWEKMETEFVIPAQDCATQKLVLRMAEPLDGMQTVTGQIYFDKMRVVRNP